MKEYKQLLQKQPKFFPISHTARELWLSKERTHFPYKLTDNKGFLMETLAGELEILIWQERKN